MSAARLKVYAARLGFFDTAVAASSQKAALAAWGVHQDLFKDGSAAATDDPAALAALDRPGVVLRRPVGSTGAYAEAAEAAPLPARRTPPKPAPEPDRRPLDQARAKLAEAEQKHEVVAADVHARMEALRAELDALESEWDRRRAELEAAVSEAEAAYRAAGGRP